MDLDGFEDPLEVPTNEKVPKALKFALDTVDHVWFVKATRSARWMDLLGDYAGIEPFVIDGEALLQIVLDDPLLAIGRDSEFSFQILHAYYLLEIILDDFKRRSANFEIIFWHETRHLSLRTGDSQWIVASRALARSMMFRHLLKLEFKVRVFDGLSDPGWKRYYFTHKPMFIMTTDGGAGDENLSDIKAARIFLQRVFLMKLLFNNLPVALLNGAEYRGSKILTFLYDCRSAPPKIMGFFAALARQSQTLLDDRLTSQSPFRLSCSIIPSANHITESFGSLKLISYIERGVAPEIIYIFIAHIVLLPSLSAQERAQARQALPDNLRSMILGFTTPLFFAIADQLSTISPSIDIDGTIFARLLIYVLVEGAQMRDVLGPELDAAIQGVWDSLDGPSLDFVAFSRRYGNASEHLTSILHQSERKPHKLLPFANSVFDTELVSVYVTPQASEAEITSVSKFNTGAIIEDTRHWHNQKSLLPSHLGGAKARPTTSWEKYRQSKGDQQFMASLQAQAATLTGASGGILQQIFIPSATSLPEAKSERRKQTSHATSGSGKKSKKEQLLAKIKDEKEVSQRDSSLKWWTQQLSELKNLPLSSRSDRLRSLARNPKTSTSVISLEIELYHLNVELQSWINDDGRESPRVRDKYTVSIILRVKNICLANRLTLRPSVKKILSSVLTALGFGKYVSSVVMSIPDESEDRRLNFSFVKLFSSKTKEHEYPFMSIVEDPIVWQLRLFGEFMDRSMDSKADRRVAFEPDAWQRKVLDGIDANKSLLVVAPTSAGKTFISFYAMEKVLRESDNGILVYIAPTKPLVNQIAAEVYARFNKIVDGRSCWAIHTREYRIHNPMECQILITVPEILAIMLLSPSYARVWTPRIKRIILDEIHSIGQEEGGAVWEQIILFAPCPIIGLSATIGSPEVFSQWLASVQTAHGFDYEFIEHKHRYSHLSKHFYVVDGKGIFTDLEKHKPTDRAKFLHPIGLLSFGPRNLPPDLSLEASDTLTLANALLSEREEITGDLSLVEPTAFFASYSTFLRQQDIIDFEASLKDTLINLMKTSDPRDPLKALGRVVQSLQDPYLALLVESNPRPSPSAFLNDLLVLLADLNKKDQLPAILFSFDRSHCDIMAKSLLRQLEKAERQWRLSDPEWERMLQQQELQRKLRERMVANNRQKKGNRETEEDPSASWEGSSIRPEDPSPQFSFVNLGTSYSRSMLEQDIDKIRWIGLDEWLFDALKRGIAIHHSGMNKRYRSLVESLFRKGFIRVMVATGTLALGINAPTKTSVFCGDSPFLTALMYRQCAGRAGRRGFDLKGNVIFYGIPLDRIQRLVLSKLPSVGGNFPLTSTLTLRLFNVLHGSNNAEVAVKAIQSVISLPQITVNSPLGQDQLLHHLRFSIEYLRRTRLLGKDGCPINLFSVASHLYYTEPSNFALVELMHCGVLHTICQQEDQQKAKRDFMILMCNLFGRRNLSKTFSTTKNMRMLQSKYPSMILLPPLPEIARKVLIDHDAQILNIFAGYALAFVTQHQDKFGQDDTLPLSRIQFRETDDSSPPAFQKHLRTTALPVVIRSSFIANSGHDDTFKTVAELTRTARAGLHLNGHALPSMSEFAHINSAPSGYDGVEHGLNAHLLDFYIHGQVKTLNVANGIRPGDIWYILQDFCLTLAVVKSALEQFLTQVPQDDLDLENEIESTAVRRKKPIKVSETWDGSDDDDEITSEKEASTKAPTTAAPLNEHVVDPGDSKVYQVVSSVLEEFTEKFKAMWA